MTSEFQRYTGSKCHLNFHILHNEGLGLQGWTGIPLKNSSFQVLDVPEHAKNVTNLLLFFAAFYLLFSAPHHHLPALPNIPGQKVFK